MQIVISTIPHESQRYPTVGDWEYVPDKETVYIRVSKTDNWRYEALVGLHELIEFLLCLDRGISTEAVDKFDMAFESKRSPNNTQEPGDDPNAPYHEEHFFATNLERLMAAELNVNWMEYEETLYKLED